MQDVRNAEGRLVCKVDEAANMVEIRIKDCVTHIKFEPDGKVKIIHIKNAA